MFRGYLALILEEMKEDPMERSLLISPKNLPREDGYLESPEKCQWILRVLTCVLCFDKIREFHIPKFAGDSLGTMVELP